jgi:transcription factor IIIB 90 kDa subunit
LNEFKATPSGQLSVRDFKALWLESEADPPAFSKGRKRNKHGQLEEEAINKAEMTSPSLLQDEAIVNIEAARDAQLMLPPKKRKRQNNVAAEQSEEGVDKVTANDNATTTTPDDSVVESSSAATDGSDKTGNSQSAKDESLSAEDDELNDEINDLMKDEAFLKAAENFSTHSQTIKRIPYHAAISNLYIFLPESEDFKEPFEADLADVDDDEIEAMLLNDDEVEIKTKVWYEFNKEYLEEQRIKMEKEIMDRKNGVYKKTGSVRNLIQT